MPVIFHFELILQKANKPVHNHSRCCRVRKYYFRRVKTRREKHTQKEVVFAADLREYSSCNNTKEFIICRKDLGWKRAIEIVTHIFGPFLLSSHPRVVERSQKDLSLPTESISGSRQVSSGHIHGGPCIVIVVLG
jgi:hypothetical protein